MEHRIHHSLALWVTVLVMISFHAAAQRSATVILPGNYPDPSIVCDGRDYYLINSTGFDNPGLPVWHSTDLQNWKRIGYALNQKLGDVWAPDLVFYKGKWYIYFTAMVNGIGNFVITAEKPEGPWSDPLRLDLQGIDPGHIATPDGRRFIFTSGGMMAELDATGTKIISRQRQVYHSWPVPEDYVIECICTESPKLIYHNNYYYLTLAQGGTAGPATSHMATSLRSKNVDGPWEYSPYNPVIRTTDKRERWWSTGHGTLFEGADGHWYMVFHAYENSFRTLGRQVLITPVEWTGDGWFREAAQTIFEDVAGSSFRDEFDSGKLDLHWAFIDETDFRRITSGGGKLTMKASGDSPVTSNPLVITAENSTYSITAKVSIREGVNAGLVLYYDSLAQWGLSVSPEGISQIVQGGCYPPFQPDSVSSAVFLKLVNDRSEISYYYSQDGSKWRKLEYSHDISGFHTNTRGGFKSIRPGLIATGSGIAEFEFFRYDAVP